MNNLVPANILRRAFAGIIDCALVLLLACPMNMIIQGSNCALFLIFLAMTCCYQAYFLGSSPKAKTLGQKVARIRVTTCDGKKVEAATAFDRAISQFLCPAVAMTLMQIVSMVDGIAILTAAFFLQVVVLFFWAYWYVLAIFSPMEQALHDVIFGTVVVIDK